MKTDYITLHLETTFQIFMKHDKQVDSDTKITQFYIFADCRFVQHGVLYRINTVFKGFIKNQNL